MSHHDQGTELTRIHDTAVVLHLFYPDLWDELRAYLANFGGACDLYVTIPSEIEIADDVIRAAVPTVRICRMENRGRDIGPFLSVFSRIAHLGYRYICKIHTKKSLHFSGGGRWRRDLLSKLVGSTDVIDRIRRAMDAQPELGLIAPAGHVLLLTPESYYWFSNKAGVRELARAAGIPFERYDEKGFPFAAGSMFWFRPEALGPVLRTAGTCEAFELESGQQDGTLAHAFERFFGLAVLHAGFSIAEVENGVVKPAETPVQVQLLLESTRDLARQLQDLLQQTSTGRQSSVQELKDRHAGQTAWVVGKGPSLAMLRQEDIGDGPVIAINDAITVVERLDLDNPLYSMQKDADAYGGDPLVVTNPGKDKYVPIQRATLLVHAHESPDRLIDYRPRYVFDNVADFSLAWSEFSSLVAAAIARLMGCAKVVYLCHDACVVGDTRTCTPHEDGSFTLARDSDSADEYLQHRVRIEEHLTRIGLPVEWMTPEFGGIRRIDQARQIEALTTDLNAAREATAVLRDELARVARDGDLLRAAVTSVSAERDHLLQEIGRLRGERETLASTEVSARQQLDDARQQISVVTRERDAASAYVDALLGSASWRWTAPLREANRLLNGRRR